MMKQFFLSAAMLVASIAGFYGCAQPDKSPNPKDDLAARFKIPAVLYGATAEGLRLPNGTTTSIENDGSTVRLTYPKGIRFASSADHALNFAALKFDGTYTCTGDCSSGCDVFYVQGSFACSQCKNGNACTGKAGRATEGGGFVDVEAGIKFIKTRQEALTLEKAQLQTPDDLLEFEYVRAAMRRLNQEVHGEADPSRSIAQNPKKYAHVAVNMFGALVDYTVPLQYLEQAVSKQNQAGKQSLQAADLFVVAKEATSFSCSCTSGGSGCTAESGFGYSKCNSGACVSCTMTVR